MQQPEFTPLPWRVEYDGQSIVMITAADGGVLLCDSSGDWPEGIAEYIVHCVNAYPALLTVVQTARQTVAGPDATNYEQLAKALDGVEHNAYPA